MEMRPQPFPPAPALLPAPQRGTNHRAPNSPEVQLPPSWSREVSGPEAVELLDHGGLGVFAEGGQVSGHLAGLEASTATPGGAWSKGRWLDAWPVGEAGLLSPRHLCPTSLRFTTPLGRRVTASCLPHGPPRA